MKMSININSDGDLVSPEIEIAGRNSDFIGLANTLMSLACQLKIESSLNASNFYHHPIRALLFVVDGSEDGMLAVLMVDDTLSISGSHKALAKLAQSLINFFSVEPEDGAHFHLSYVEGDPLLRETKCHLIFVSRI
jgi:hypothetical protein